jgi:hypothetical protein
VVRGAERLRDTQSVKIIGRRSSDMKVDAGG